MLLQRRRCPSGGATCGAARRPWCGPASSSSSHPRATGSPSSSTPTRTGSAGRGSQVRHVSDLTCATCLISRVRCLVPTLTFARRHAGDPLGARFLSLAGPSDWDGQVTNHSAASGHVTRCSPPIGRRRCSSGMATGPAGAGTGGARRAGPSFEAGTT